ncbi:MAG: hypothetical protein LBN39_01855 [Planctomycetaceae bacterium]|jgi:hypothetical protein|nr:hypothetical protein [Planctomycetaceae bacterium]
MKHSYFSFLLLTVYFCCPFFAAGESIQPVTDFKADWLSVDKLPVDAKTGAVVPNLWLTFRRDFTLNEVPEKAVARIACDSKYWLYVNGQTVVFEGQLKRGPTPDDTYFDKVDLAKYLKAGKNQIAVLMWYFGKNGFSHKSSGVPGFLFDASTNGKNGLNLLSDSTWKVHLYTKLPDNNETWKNNPYTAFERITADPQPNYRLSESNIRYDARFEFKGDWKAADFNDSDWQQPKVIGKVPCAPWNRLYERPIPQWKDYGVKDYLSVSSNGLPQVSDGKPIICKLPYNAQITPLLKVDAPEGYTIDIRSDDYQGGGEYNVRAEYITKKGEQEYESLGWMNGHQVIYTMPVGVKILSLQYRETGYDTEFAGAFECDDAFCNELWKKSVRTLYVTMRDTYFDCPDRERAQWWGDAVNELGEAFYALDQKSALLPRKGMYELLRWQLPNGVIFSPVPAGAWDRELPMQMLATVGKYGIGNWCKTTGDFQPLKEFEPQIKKYLSLFEYGEDGLVLHRRGAWDWGDWGDNIDLRVLTNCWYYLALDSLILSAELNGDKDTVKFCQEQKEKIRTNFDKVFWTGTEYRDPAYKKQTDDRANAMAVIAGLAGQDKFPQLRDVLLKQKHASPYMEKYVLEALFKIGYENDAFIRMKERFKKMTEHPDYTTLWEGWGIGSEGFGGGTINHAWSGGGLTMLSQYAAGVHFVSPKEFLIIPQPGPLKWLKSKTPTQFGILSVELKNENGKITGTITLPKGTNGKYISKDGKTDRPLKEGVNTVE